MHLNQVSASLDLTAARPDIRIGIETGVLHRWLPQARGRAKAPAAQARALPNSAGYLDGQLLIAMPVMGDARFERSVIYLCAHSAEGAMGIIVNHPAGSIDFPELLAAARHHQEGRAHQAAGECREHEGAAWRAGRYRPRLRAAFQRFLHRERDAPDRRRRLPHRDRRHPAGDRQRLRPEARHPRARLCRLGAGPARDRDPEQWLAALRCGCGFDLRRRCRREVRRALRKIGIDPGMLSNEAGHA